MKVSIIIVNYNGKKVLPVCLTSIYNQTYKNFEVIIVDNASTDESVFDVEDNFPKVKIIKNKINYGFAKGNNIGIKRAKGEYIIMVNPDTEMNKDFLEEMLYFASLGHRTAFVTPKVIRKDTGEIDTYGIRVPKSGLGKDIKEIDELKYMIAPCGVSMMWRRKALDDIAVKGEYLDEDFFAYCEDTDLGIRAILRDWSYGCVPNAIIYHNHSHIMKSAPSYIQLLGHRNNILTVIKNYPRNVLIKALPSIIFWQLASIALYCIKFKPHIILKLKWDAWKLLPKMLEKRKIIQSRIKIDNFGDYLV